MRDSCLYVEVGDVHDRHRCVFRGRAGRRREADHRLQRPGHRTAFSDRRVDVCEERRRIGDVQVHDFRRVHHAAAADGDVAVAGKRFRDVDGRSSGRNLTRSAHRFNPLSRTDPCPLLPPIASFGDIAWFVGDGPKGALRALLPMSALRYDGGNAEFTSLKLLHWDGYVAEAPAVAAKDF